MPVLFFYDPEPLFLTYSFLLLIGIIYQLHKSIKLDLYFMILSNTNIS